MGRLALILLFIFASIAFAIYQALFYSEPWRGKAFTCIIIILLHTYIHLRFIARICAGLVENGTGILISVLLGLGSALLQGNVSYGRDDKDGMESIYMSNI